MHFQKREKNSSKNMYFKRFFRIILFLLVFFVAIVNVSFAQDCGDGVCQAGGEENSCTCPVDCGSCGGTISNLACKEYACINNICLPTFISNCCGNTSCETNESYGSCPIDCEPTSLELEVLSPKDQETFFLGDTIVFKVNASSSGRSAAASDINSTGFFGVLRLFNDGKHDDNATFDRIFANQLLVSDLNAGFYELLFQGSFRGIYSGVKQKINIKTNLTTTLDIKSKYKRGEIVSGKGQIVKGVLPVSIPLNVEIYFGEKEILKQTIQSDSNGFYSFEYQTSLIDELGQWTIMLTGNDESQNSFELEKKFILLSETSKEELFITTLKELTTTLNRGENFELFVQVLNDQNDVVTEADLVLETPNAEIIKFKEVQPGVYEAFFKVPTQLQIGEQVFRIIAIKENTNHSAEGQLVLIQKITSAVLNIQILEPQENYYKVGAIMPVLLKITYLDQKPVVGSIVKILLNQKEYILEPVEEGLYQTNVEITNEDYGELTLSFNATDNFGNEGFKQVDVTIAKRTAFFEIFENPVISLIIFIILFAIGAVIILPFFSVFSVYNLQEKKKKIIKQKELLQKKYFDHTSIDKKFYEQNLKKLNSDLDLIEEELKKVKK